jgi:hypothetical protein
MGDYRKSEDALSRLSRAVMTEERALLAGGCLRPMQHLLRRLRGSRKGMA